MGQAQHKYAAVHLYFGDLQNCYDFAPSIAYLLPGSYCDNTDEYGRDKSGVFYTPVSEWWNDPPYSDFGWGKLPYQGSTLVDETDVCGSFTFNCPEIALYSNQSICDFESLCPPPEECSNRTLGNSLNEDSAASNVLFGAQFYRIECGFDVQGSVLFRELDQSTCDGFEELYGNEDGMPAFEQSQNYAGWWALPSVMNEWADVPVCVDTTLEDTYWQRWVWSMHPSDSSSREIDVKFFSTEEECEAYNPHSELSDSDQGVKSFASRVVSALSSTVWNILLSKVLHADVLSGSDCFVRQGGLTCEYDNNVEYEDTSSAYAACNANVDCNGVLEVPNADPSAAPAYHVCESEFSSNPETTSVAHKSFCRSPPWKTGCDQSESQISAFPVGLVAFPASSSSWVGWVWFFGVVGVLIGVYFLWRLFCWKPCKKFYDRAVAEGSKRRVKPWKFEEAVLEKSEKVEQQKFVEELEEEMEAEQGVAVAFEDIMPRAWPIDRTPREEETDVGLRKYCFRAGPLGIHFKPLLDPQSTLAQAIVQEMDAGTDSDDAHDGLLGSESHYRKGAGVVGVAVARLEPGGRAEEAGVKEDVLVSKLNGRDVTHMRLPEFLALLSSLKRNHSGVFATLHTRIVDASKLAELQLADANMERPRLRSNSLIGDTPSGTPKRVAGRSQAMRKKLAATGWYPVMDTRGRKYFVRPAVEPIDSAIDKQIPAALSWYNPWVNQWHETTDENGETFYFNGLLQTSSWTQPENFVDVKADQKKLHARAKLLRTKLAALEEYSKDQHSGFTKEELESEQDAIKAELKSIDREFIPDTDLAE